MVTGMSSPGGSGSDSGSGTGGGTWLDTVADVHPYDQQFTIGEADEELELHGDVGAGADAGNRDKDEDGDDWI